MKLFPTMKLSHAVTVSLFLYKYIQCIYFFVCFAEWQANFDDISMDTTTTTTSSGGVAAMDTTNSPWDGVGSSASAGAAPPTSNDAGWAADFNKEKSETGEAWADFSNFSGIDSTNLNKSE